MNKYALLFFMAINTMTSFGQTKVTAETVKVNGIELYYEAYGEGPPLLLLHGWTQSSSFWSEYIPSFAENFRVYAVDLRGHGRTSPLSSDFSIKKCAEDISLLLDHLKIEKAKAIGLSYGGLTLLELARSNPEKIESMVLIGASPNYKGGESTEGENDFSFENLPPSFIEELRNTHVHGESQIKALFDPTLDYQIQLSDEELKAFGFKTLVISGDRDEILGIESALRLHRNIPNTELWIVPNTGHLAIVGPNQENFITTSLRFFSDPAPIKPK